MSHLGPPPQALPSFVYDALPGRVVFGARTSRAALAPQIERLEAQRILAISSARDAELLEQLCAPFVDRVVARVHDVKPHVPVDVANAARALARGEDADCLLALGGGSAIGTAKAIALERPLPIVAVATTYAGSEMTPIWGLTEGGRKTTGRANAVLPAVVIYDPELTLTLPPRIAAPSAMNAIAHCIEALYAPGANPVCSLLAAAGVGALARGIRAVVADPGDQRARAETLYGAYLAGVCLAGAGTALHHRICHVLGGAYNLPHAETHSAILPPLVAFIEPAAQAQLAPAASALGLAHPSELATALHDLALDIGAPTALDQFGFTNRQLPEATRLILDTNPPDRPRPIDAPQLTTLLHQAIHGRRPTV